MGCMRCRLSGSRFKTPAGRSRFTVGRDLKDEKDPRTRKPNFKFLAITGNFAVTRTETAAN
jgi:hypothetical protein